MAEKVKLGIIGTGGISGSHMASYAKNPNVELYAFCDINEDVLNAKADQYGVTRRYTDYNEMLKLEELDAVDICAWNSVHAPAAIAALNAGKHVFCEKPMASNLADAYKMKEAADKAGKLLMIGFVRRYANDCKILKDFIDADSLGEIYYTKANYLRRKGNPGRWFGNKAISGGGPLIDLGVHVIDLVRYLMGNPKPVSVYGATYQKLFDRKNVKGVKAFETMGYVSQGSKDDICDVEDLAVAMVRFDNGAVLNIETSFSLNIKEDKGEIELFGTKGGVKLNPNVELYTEMNNYMVDVEMGQGTIQGLTGLWDNEMNHFIDCVQNGAACKSPAEDGIVIMQILDAIYRSAELGHEIEIG